MSPELLIDLAHLYETEAFAEEDEETADHLYVCALKLWAQSTWPLASSSADARVRSSYVSVDSQSSAGLLGGGE